MTYLPFLWSTGGPHVPEPGGHNRIRRYYEPRLDICSCRGTHGAPEPLCLALDLPVTAFLGVLLGGRVPSIGVNSLRSISEA